MKISILFFGMATDLVDSSSLEIELPSKSTVANFKEFLLSEFPELQKMSSYAVAINESYATDDILIKENDVIAIIPPVSGG
ncbi:molybdopterin synthase catalytic subunit/molybdopterin synthase sulfur carrier subunit [Tenacibaculum lutimaris]|uniref:Molybdopterin synthase sulfur carrier subunit n=2 Tax=Tenacibaculum TaxID=104267 RepID=A0A420E5R4_9FLAO|nr:MULTISPECIES: molybdopterin converting factor subunit 1 [Tenacibaculum]MDP2539908.1 molybdopterin converting factor subunit 1 [Tenacibaculum discolor]PHN97876.1 molybdopterin converting factor subunit 1 [Tenacibaculum discolor]PHN99682.1 molybdopterin converting factor subunit 1 [Rhodobacteraceae bacterium 4F10]RKF05273.1 molybdopterin synthase catalytic subunit/molybdopterin synthase sulfur carrier subunit [Tenacibaculum lutimaris]